MSFVIQRGHGMPVYSGHVRRQVGGSIFGFLRRIVAPLAKKLFGVAKPHLVNFGKKAASEAVRVGGQALGDIASGNISKLPETLKEESRKSVNNISNEYIGQPVFQEGAGFIRKRRHSSSKQRRKTKKKRKSVINKKQKRRKKQAEKVDDIFS